MPLPHPKNGLWAILGRRLFRDPPKIGAAVLVAVRSALFQVLGYAYATGGCIEARSSVHVVMSRDAHLDAG